MKYKLLTKNDSNQLLELIKLFGDAFEDPATYLKALPSNDYLQRFLENSSNLVLVAVDDKSTVLGGLVAYVLDKFEQNRKEIFVYDLGIATAHQRKGLGTGLLNHLKTVAKQLGAYQIFVEAEGGDDRAIEFYKTIANEEIKAHHFTIPVD